MGRVSEKVILVTGGARGMGAAHARLLVAEGAKVVITDILDNEGATFAAELGPSAIYVRQDVAQPGEWSQAIAAAEGKFGALHGLVNNAGIASMAPIERFPLEQWEKTLAVNLTGVFLGMQTALPAMRRAGGGSIVNISSVEGLRGSAGLHAYVASKFGVRGHNEVRCLGGRRVRRSHKLYPSGLHQHSDDREHRSFRFSNSARAASRAAGSVTGSLVPA
ncbi:NAD(P)-dependent dehydrogenase (short-subunit alcohol dehydrogenase family) [Bradyrhizobium yuanmingense]